MKGALHLHVVFFRTSKGREPVRQWLKRLDQEARKRIGEDIKLIQFRWPLGMPLVRKIEQDLWEVRSRLKQGQISRVFFTIDDNEIILLHGFIKKSQKTPKKDLTTARSRKDIWLKESKHNE